MKTKQLLGRTALIAGLSMTGVSSVSAAVSIALVPFETEGVSNPSDLDSIKINALISSTYSGVTIKISNDSIIGEGYNTATMPTVTLILFESTAGVVDSAPTVSAGSAFLSKDNATLPGGSSIGFNVTFGFSAPPPPVKNGLDPEEYVTFSFAGTDYDGLLTAIAGGDFRIGVHVQEIGETGLDSVSLVTVPEPSAALLGGIGALLLLRRRR